MPVAKLLRGGSPNAMKSEEGNDSLDTFIGQAIGKEPLLPISRTGDNPVQWIQLLHALDQPDLLGWPLTTPMKVQMQKCEKCSLEFCSPINYRRHIRVHRRSLNVNKGSHKNRHLLAAFWDKLSLEKAKELVSLDGVMLEEIPGSSVIRALVSSLHKPGVWTLPQVYVRAGSSLLDIIQAKPSRLPISSQELFDILDDASERTFLFAGTPESVQKYLFDGEAAKNSLELKNLVASTSFLFEQQLVKAWVADKDAEALRCQKLLVEEEEAAKKRLAELLERKKRKKLRQKEHKLREQFHRCEGDLNVAVDAADRPVLAEVSVPLSPSDSSSNSIDKPANLDPCLESLRFQSKNSEKDLEAQIDFSSECSSLGDSENIESQMVGEFIQKIDPFQDRALLNGSRVWTKMEGHVECLKPSLHGGIGHQIQVKENNCELLIGSISVPVDMAAVERGNEDSEGAVVLKKVGDRIFSSERCMPSLYTYENRDNHDQVQSDGNGLQGIVPLSSIAAKEFLAQRWKEATSANHVQLVLSTGCVPS